jgi:hypothetical protein
MNVNNSMPIINGVLFTAADLQLLHIFMHIRLKFIWRVRCGNKGVKKTNKEEST